MTAVASGADALANTLLESLTTGLDFTVPDVDLTGLLFAQPASTGPLYETVEPIEFSSLTTGEVGGTGVFDKLMESLVAHLKVEFAANRISGAEYTKAYIGIIQAALQTAQTFLLAKDQSYWQSLLIQAQARAAEMQVVQSRIELETARVNLARSQYEALTVEVNYGLTKIKIATEDAAYANAVKQGINLDEQTENLIKTGVGINFANTNMMPQQEKLLKEQVEVQRAQTQNTRSDGTTEITGLIGKQKDLYGQQIISYQRDAEMKVGKLFTDAYVTNLTILEGAGGAPDEFSNANINEVLVKLKANLNLN